jgi:hypothetical protein
MSAAPADNPVPAEGQLISEYEVFARLPEWVLDAAISDKAVRLFAVLLRHADKGGKAFPSRARIADRLHCSIDSVDRAMAELKHLGAVHVEQQGGRPGEAWKTNIYRLLRQPSRTAAATPGRMPADNLAAPVPDEREPPNESQEPTPIRSPGRRKTRVPLPDDWSVDDGLRDWAAENAPLVNLVVETPIFEDHHRAKGTVMKDWRRAWMTWMRNAQKTAAGRLAAQQARESGGGAAALDRAVHRMEGRG